MIISVILILFLIPVVSAGNVTINNHTSIKSYVDDADVIKLDAGVYRENNIEIKKNLTIEGNGRPEDIIIDGEHENNIINANTDINLIIRNVTFINALYSGNGGAISFYNNGHLIVENCIFINNHVNKKNGEGLGGAIYTHSDSFKYSNLNVKNCIFINNSAVTDGGCINTKFGNINIDNSLFVNNSANRDGGAISTRGLANVIIHNSNFSNNYADEWGGAINNWLASFEINNCLFNLNYAGERGGAISSCGSTIMNYSKLIENSALSEGGGLHFHQDSIKISANLNYNEFIENDALIGKTLFIQRNSDGEFDFENNYWGDNNPNWDDEAVLNGACESVKTWVEKNNATIIASDLKRAYNSPYDFSAKFLNKHGYELKNSEVIFCLDNKNYTTFTDSEGVSKLVLNLNPGNYKILIINPKTNETLKKTLAISTRIRENSKITAYYLKATYKVRVKGDDGSFAKSGEIVTFKIDKSTYQVKTDSKGYAILKITKTSGKYTVTASYKGESVKDNVVIKKNLKASDLSKKKSKKIKYSVCLNSKEKNKKITFKINGKTFKAKTNSKGKTTVTLSNLKKGKYKITVKYGDEIVKKTIKIF